MNVRPGLLTSEGISMLITQVLAVIALVDPGIGDVHRFDGLVQALGVVASAIATAFYSHARSQVKAAALHAPARSSAPSGREI
ncbi:MULTISPECIES: hypothetical protein [Frankia]|uniref:hypothetical protein n=1 Tax=Frankia TaxID=1854 RepID=UPI0003134906|nr:MULTISPECIES: hypothetical protein [Frankia]